MHGSSLRRRELLTLLGGGTAAGLAGCAGVLPGGEQSSGPTEPVGDDRARRLAEQFAPTLYFDAAETWFPTDPRPYASEQDGERVVTGFDAVDGYLRDYEAQGGAPPNPTVFYNARTYPDTTLSVVQFWSYSAFDQFTTNFHWHDWEVLHVFVDDRSGAAQLYVASAHARKVPNNEFLDPQTEPRVLAELGSHSSGVSLNAEAASFQRFSLGSLSADVTNDSIDAVEALTDFPVAYGLPRDEGYRLPYVVPELDGKPVYDHPEIPHFEREHLAPPELTVRSFADLATPPTDLPPRETGVTLGPEGGETETDHTYSLAPTTAVEDISAFTGPQLSFEFAIPKFAENAVASHLTTTAAPWTQPRYRDPLADVTDSRHRAALADRYGLSPGGLGTQIVGVLRDVVPNGDAPDGEGVTTTDPTVESVALVESDPVAVPSFGGVVVARGLPAGEHRLTVNTAGKAPYAERVRVNGDNGETATAGPDGHVGLVANRDATKLRVDPTTVDADLREFSVADDFGGELYRTHLDGTDAVYVHRGGAYTAEVVDADGAVGAFRFNHDLASDRPATVERPRTGKASLASFLADISAGTRRTVQQSAADGVAPGVRGLLTALDAVREAAERAAERASAGDAKGANARLRAVQTRLSKVRDALATVRGAMPNGTSRAAEKRLSQAERRTKQALAAEKL
ncbi:hypothetical protein [Halospeciosus flavus]|uniref:Lipoprotein n=1 Tax=Halospeciosus flavus TaxID=3032283 RepID=A0ABD5Z5Q5_9EURY|nr:hypothetical protein [Halospeciosus flavus]